MGKGKEEGRSRRLMKEFAEDVECGDRPEGGPGRGRRELGCVLLTVVEGRETASGCRCRSGDIAVSEKGVQLGLEKRRAAGTVEAHFKGRARDQSRIRGVMAMKRGRAGRGGWRAMSGTCGRGCSGIFKSVGEGRTPH